MTIQKCTNKAIRKIKHKIQMYIQKNLLTKLAYKNGGYRHGKDTIQAAAGVSLPVQEEKRISTNFIR